MMGWWIRFLGFALLLCLGGYVLAITMRRRAAAHRARLVAERAGDTFEHFRVSLMPVDAPDALLHAVYSALSLQLPEGTVPPRRFDELERHQGIEFPDEVTDLLDTAVRPLGYHVDLSPKEFAKLRTVGDLVDWLARQHPASAV